MRKLFKRSALALALLLAFKCLPAAVSAPATTKAKPVRTEYYQALTPAGQSFYRNMEQIAVKNGIGFAFLPGDPMELDELSDGYTAFRADHPEYLRANTPFVSCVPRLGYVCWMERTFDLSRAQVDQTEAAVERLCQGLEALPPQEQVAALYRALTSTVTYHKGDPANYSAYGALVDTVACCDGISAALSWCLTTLDLENQIVLAKLPGSQAGHAWNAVKLDGVWYELDATWDLGREEENWQYFLAPQLHPEAQRDFEV